MTLPVIFSMTLVPISAAGQATPVQLAPLARAEGATDAFQARLAENADPSKDGWRTEVLSAAADRKLGELVGRLASGDAFDPDALRGWVGDDFRASALRPARLDEAFSDGTLSVRRWPADVSGADLRGPAGLAEALRGLAAGLGTGGEIHTEVKLIRIETGDSDVTTTFLYEASRRSDEGSIQQNATWRARWSNPADGATENLEFLHLELVDYEEAEMRFHAESAASEGDVTGTLFVDGTTSAMAGVDAYEEQVLPGLDHWLSRISRIAGMSIVGHHGLAVGDVDGDGLEDLYVTDAAGLPNRLYIQQDDGTVRDASSGSGVDWLDPSASALLVDLDGDGDQDLAVATAFRLLLSENDGRGRFTLRASLHEVVTAPTSLSAADYDEDGDLDLYLCGYDGDRDPLAVPGPVPYHDARNGGRNALLENRGGFRFEDITQSVGLDDNNHSFSFAAAWDDYDDDGDLDLYVANDFGRNNLYRNDGGSFRDVAGAAGVEDVATGMSAAWGDYDRDGRRDIYVSNMFSSAGNRVAYQRSFAASASDETVADIQRMARGNTLFRNAGDGSFDDVSSDAGVYMGLWAWASRFADLNNDGWLDLVVSNGYVTNEDTGDL